MHLGCGEPDPVGGGHRRQHVVDQRLDRWGSDVGDRGGRGEQHGVAHQGERSYVS